MQWHDETDYEGLGVSFERSLARSFELAIHGAFSVTHPGLGKVESVEEKEKTNG